MRDLPADLLNESSSRIITWIMLNPSTADAETDDPTIRRVCDYSKRWNAGKVIVANLFDYRATNPKDLAAPNISLQSALWKQYTTAAVQICDQLIFAWGSSVPASVRDQASMARNQIKTMAATANKQPMCLAINSDGQPKHPLYCQKSALPIPYSA